MPALRLYDYSASANCYKVRLLLAQLRRDYERVAIDIFDGDTLTDEYAAINPARATPVLEVGDGSYLTESNAILFYLTQGSDFLPDDPFDRADVVRWLIMEQTDVMMSIGGLRFRLITERFARDSEDAQRRHRIALETLELLDGHLSRNRFFVSERYGIADIAMYGYIHVAPDAGIDLAQFPAVERWLDRVRAQPGYMHDLSPYPANAWPGVGRSQYG